MANATVLNLELALSLGVEIALVQVQEDPRI